MEFMRKRTEMTEADKEGLRALILALCVVFLCMAGPYWLITNDPPQKTISPVVIEKAPKQEPKPLTKSDAEELLLLYFLLR